MRLYGLIFLAMAFLVSSCGDGNGLPSHGGPGGSLGGPGGTTSGSPAVTVAASPASIPVSGTSTITATVLDSSGALVPDGTSVSFSLSAPALGTINATANTVSGIATATFTASTTPGSVTVTATSGTASNTATITISTQVATVSLTANPVSITVDGTSSLSATVLDSISANMPDGTVVSFSLSSSNLGTINPQATTSNGIATATFSASTTPGTVTVTATSGNVSDTVDILIDALSPGSINFDSATPTLIGIRGTGQPETSVVKFIVKDVNFNPVVDGTSIDFCLLGPGGGRLPQDGGEYIGQIENIEETFTDLNANNCYDTGEPFTDSNGNSIYDSPLHAVVSTVNGEANVFLNSGTVPGTANIIATITATGSSSSSTPISIGGGVPNHAHLTIARTPVNLEGLAFVNIQSTVSLFMADRFGNYNVLEGTSVSFYTESGAIDTSSTVDNTGATSVIYRTQSPDPVNVAPIDNVTPGCDGGAPASLGAALNAAGEWEVCLQAYVNQAKPAGYALGATSNPRDGWATVVVSTRGEEAFNDANGNGLFDGAGEFDIATQDTSQEAFIDVDDDNTRDDGSGGEPFEIFNDDDGNSTYNMANGVWDADKTIFKDIPMLITGSPAYIEFNQNSGLAIADTGSLTFKILVADTNLNHLIGGSKITISHSGGGKLVGSTSYTFPDLFTYGPMETSVTLDDSDAGDNAGSSPKGPEAFSITVKVNWKGTDFERSISGTID